MAYDVGYKKPPKETQFKKGVCPNPRGRGAAQRKTEGEILRDVLNQQIEYLENGKTKLGTLMEVIITSYAMQAAKGDPAAAKMLLKLRTHFANHGDINPAIIWAEEGDDLL